MDEIRFRQSEDEVEDWLSKAKQSPLLSYSCCDKCKHHRSGFYNISNRQFICLSCLAVEMYEKKVGKPSLPY